MKMKRMPYRVNDGAIEQAKYRAKMAVREAAHPTEQQSLRRVRWRWVTATATAVAVVIIGVVFLVEFLSQKTPPQPQKPVVVQPMDKLVTQMKSASDEIIYEMAVDDSYYLEGVNAL